MECGCTAPYIGPPLTQTCGGGSFLIFMGILDTLIRRTCDVSEICQRITPRVAPDDEYDFVVIGGGSGGSTAAGRLAQVEGWKVLLLEAGGDESPGTQVPSMVNNFVGASSVIDWNYKTEPQPIACQGYKEKRCTWPRGKVLGGTSVIHGMMYMRGLPSDYDKWEAAGNEGWGNDDVLPIFKRIEGNTEVGTLVSAENYGSEGPLTISRFEYEPGPVNDILKAAEELDYPIRRDLNSEHHDGFTIAQANIRNGARLSSARTYVRPQRNNPNFHVMLNSTATKILVEENDGTKTAVGVQFVYKNVSYTVRVRKEVVLAAGTLNSPQILFLSGIGAKSELDRVGIEQVHELPGVGKNLTNHVSFGLTYYMNTVKDFDDLNWVAVLNYILHRKGPMTSPGLSQVTARISSPYADSSGPDTQMFFSGYTAGCSYSGAVGEPENPSKPNQPKTLQMRPVLIRPKSRGYVSLKSNSVFDAPAFYPNYFTDPTDLLVLLANVRTCQKLANTTALKTKYDLQLKKENYGSCESEYEYDSDDFWICAIKYSTLPENHQACTCRMGPRSDPNAVVDSHLRVHGIDGLRIADASVMPTVVAGNPHGTIVMIANRAVDFIREKWLTNEQ